MESNYYLKLSLLDLDQDTFHLIIEDIWLTASIRGSSPGQVQANRGIALLPLSETCRQMREATLPRIFREVYNWPGSLWPRSLWKYFKTIHVRDICRLHVYEPRPINIDDLILALPFMLSTTRLVIRLTTPPPNDLLAAAATLPHLEFLEIEEARLTAFLPALKSFTSLKRLTVTVVPQMEDTPYSSVIDTHTEQANVINLLRTVSSHLSYLEIAGDLLSLPIFTSIQWPNLRTLIISGHQPNEPHLPLQSIISGMPMLVDLSLTFSAIYGSNVSPFLFCPRDDVTYATRSLTLVAPQVRSLTLSNVFPEDEIIYQLPSDLTRLRILAIKDAIPYGEEPIHLWNPYSPLSLERSFDIVKRLVHLLHLVELSLTIIGTPTPELVRAIGDACPRLRVLELEQEQYEYVDAQSPSDLGPYVEPLNRLPCLRILRITLIFVKRYIWRLGWDLEDLNHAKAAKFFAEKVPLLEVIAFSIRPPVLTNWPGPAIWNPMVICRDVRGRPTKIFQLHALEKGRSINLLDHITADVPPISV